MSQRKLRPGQQPYDYANGLRVGGISGALIGGGLFVLLGWPWLIVAGAVAGAIGGYLWYRRERHHSG